MPLKAAPNTAATETLIAAAVVLTLAVLFGARQWLDRRRRDHQTDLTEDDARHLASRDWRRWGVAAILGLIGLLMIASTRIDVRRGPDAARLWGWTWLGVLALTVVLLVLALIDWRATAADARRQVRALAEEHRALLTDAIRYRDSQRDGQSDQDS